MSFRLADEDDGASWSEPHHYDDDEVATDTEPDILESRSPHQASGSRQGRSINGHSTVPLLDFSSLGTSSSPNRHRGPLSPSSLTAIPTYRSGQRTSETHPTTAPLSSPTANGHPSARGPARAETAPELSATQKTASISPMANKQPATHGPVPPRDGPKNVHTEPASGSVQGTSRTQVATASARHTTPLRRNATEPGPASSSRHGNRARSASGPLSDDWHYRVIVHDDKCVSWLDKHHIPWGVQWQIALGISHGKWTWEDITEEKLIQLKGKTEFGAPRVRKTIKPVPEDTPKTEAAADLQIWQELDREQAALKEGKGRGLGLMGNWKGAADWHGGCIRQVAVLDKDPQSQKYVVRLEKPEKRYRSHRFGRFLTSRRIIHLRIPKKLMRDEVNEIRRYLCAKFVIFGRIFVPFRPRKNGVILVETDEDYKRSPDRSCGDDKRLSFWDFLEWHNPPELNQDQGVLKYGSRMDIGLSNSVPILEFAEENIIEIEDIFANCETEDARPEANMTDGAGFLNGRALSEIRARNCDPFRQTGYQGRIAGAKGLWVLHPSDRSMEAPPRIWIRDSQRKIKYANLKDRAHRIFEMLGPPRVSPFRFCMQSIMNLSHNKVPNEVFCELWQKGLENATKPLLDWDGPNAMKRLWKAVYEARAGGFRVQRQSGDVSRLIGLRGRDREEDDDDDDNDDDGDDEEAAEAEASGRKPYSEQPISPSEAALVLLQAGFKPMTSEVLLDKIRYILKSVIDTGVKEYRVGIAESREVFIIPDPYGVLKEGEVYFRAAEAFTDEETGMPFDTLVGPLLIGRRPMRLPADIQKVQGVDVTQLRDYLNVLVVSTKGNQSPASLLSGGDYDGDTVFVIWDSLLTRDFTNSPYTPSPPGFEENFDKDGKSVAECLSDASGKKAEKRLQQGLMASLKDSKLGQYSLWHDTAVYERGLDDGDTMFLGHMANTLVDSGKSGRFVQHETFREHANKFDINRPSCMITEEQDVNSFNNRRTPSRVVNNPFVLEILRDEARKLKEKLLKDFEERKWGEIRDEDLLLPYKDAKKCAEQARTRGDELPITELKRLEVHVSDMLQQWGNHFAKKRIAQPHQARPREKKDLPLSFLRRFAQEPGDMVSMINVEEVKASCAYTLRSNFGFSVAFGALCRIKARRHRPAPMTYEFNDCLSIPSTYIRIWDRLDTTHDEYSVDAEVEDE